MRLRPSRCAIALTVVTALALGTSLSAGVSATASAGVMRWPSLLLDAADDANGGPDVTKVELGGDKDARIIGLRLTIANYVADSGFNIYFDTDHNRTTGTNGYEYMLWLQGTSWNLNVSDAGAWKRTRLSPAAQAIRSSDGFEFQLSPDDLGGTTFFNFHVVTFTSLPGDGGAAVLTAADHAPDLGGFDYSLNAIANAPHPPPVIKSLGAKPSGPRAGRHFTVDFTVTDRETFAPAVTAQVTVTMRIGGRSLRVAKDFHDGVLAGTTTLPPNVRGRKLVVTVVARLRTSTARHQETFRVR